LQASVEENRTKWQNVTIEYKCPQFQLKDNRGITPEQNNK
jgi:hypothetical protein